MVESLEGRDLPSSFVWDGASGAWSNPANWRTPTGGAVTRAPGALDKATINSGSVSDTAQLKLTELDVNGGAVHLVGTLRAPDTITTLNLSGGTIYERGELAGKNINWDGGAFVGTGASAAATWTNIPGFGNFVTPGSATTIIKSLAGGTFNISGNVTFRTVNFDLLGTTDWQASTATGDSSSAFINEPGGTLNFNAPPSGTITLTYVNIQNNGTATINAVSIVAQDPPGQNYVPTDFSGGDYYVFWNTSIVNLSTASVFSINGSANLVGIDGLNAWTDGATYDSGTVITF
jgi:hypothetical protein